MKPAAKRTFSLLLSAVLLVLAIIGYAVFVRPAYSEIVQLRGVLKSKNSFFKEQNLAISRVNNLILQYQGTGQLQDTISLSFPLKEDLSAIFNQLRTLAVLNGLTIDIFGVKPMAFQSLSGDPLVKNIGTLQLSLKLTGPYAGFKSFLRGLETNIRIMDTQETIIEGLDKYRLIINTYYQG